MLGVNVWRRSLGVCGRTVIEAVVFDEDADAVVASVRPGRASFQVSRRISSRASLIHFTRWNASRQTVAFSPRARRTSPIYSAASQHTRRTWAQRWWPRASKKPSEGLLVVVLSGPDQPAAVVVDDHGEVAVAALVGDLVDPDAHQPVEGVDRSPGLVDDSGHARTLSA